MADLSKAQQKRAESRKRRRDQAAPEPESATSEMNEASDGQDTRHGVLQAAKVAAAAGAAGAAVAAAKALTSHDDDASAKDAEPPEQPEPEEPQAAEEPEPEPAEEPQASDDEAEPEREPEPEPEPREQAQPVAGAAQSDARRALDRAREQFEDLLGRPVEKVSSLERTHDGWVLALEVVELQRIPETTDVLASYEMELDDELNLRRYQQVRRYHRGRTDGGDDR
jgi:hypothetical protein